jgi:uncharacterized protein YcnI
MKAVNYNNVSFFPQKMKGWSLEKFKEHYEKVFKSETKKVYEKYVKPLGESEKKPDRVVNDGVGSKSTQQPRSGGKSD